MTQFIWMSDTHYSSKDIYQHSPTTRLNAAIDFINAHYTDADFCILSGDIVNRGGDDEYKEVAEILKRLKPKIFPMVGNHDTRDLFKNHLPVPSDSMHDFVQYCIDTPQGLILCLDTLNAGFDNGSLCDMRLNWLNEKLAAAGENPVYIFMHHPPEALNLPQQDTSCLENSDAFFDLVNEFGNVQYLFLAHVHRPVMGTLRGIPFATMRSVLYQAPAPRPSWTWNDFAPATEAPNIGLVTLNKGGLTMQYLQFCDANFGVSK